MGAWVSVKVEAPSNGMVAGRAIYSNPSQDWLDAILWAVRNGIRFPCPDTGMNERPMIILNLDLRTEYDPTMRAVEIIYAYEP